MPGSFETSTLRLADNFLIGPIVQIRRYHKHRVLQAESLADRPHLVGHTGPCLKAFCQDNATLKNETVVILISQTNICLWFLPEYNADQFTNVMFVISTMYPDALPNTCSMTLVSVALRFAMSRRCVSSSQVCAGMGELDR